MSDYIPRLYEENEIHRCNTCGQTIRVLFAAVPIDPLQCCGKSMDFLGINAAIDVSDAQKISEECKLEYKKDQRYLCVICGLEVLILRNAFATIPLDCCGEGMDLIN